MSVEKKVDRTDNKFTVTLSKKQNGTNKGKDASVYGSIPSTPNTPPLTSTTSKLPKSPKKDLEDKKLEAVIQNITKMNNKIRDKYELPTKSPETTISVDGTTDSEGSMDFSNANKMLGELKIVDGDKISKCDHVDYLGRPLTHALAMTPYPAASTTDRRMKAQNMLQNLSKKPSPPPPSVYIPAMDEIPSKSKMEKIGNPEKESKGKGPKGGELPKNICQKCGTCMICAKRCDKSHEGGKTLSEQAREMSAKKKIRIKRLRNAPRRKLSVSIDTEETSSDSAKRRKKNHSKKIMKKKTQAGKIKSNSKE